MEQGEGRLMGLMKGKGDPDSEPVPGWWPQIKVWLSAECTLKDVKMSFFFSFIQSLLSILFPPFLFI